MRTSGEKTPARVRLQRVLTYPLRLGSTGEDWPSTRFGTLALVNNLSATGDALVAVALAGSVFVSVPLHAARGRTALGLVCTMLPFAVVAPLTGPFADRVRRGKGFVVTMAAGGRLAAVVTMGLWIHSLLLFPAAFVALVCSKTHSIARAALVPTVVTSESQLVSANAKLAVGGGVASAMAAGLGGGIYSVFGSKAVLNVDVFVFALLTVFAAKLISMTAPSGGSRNAGKADRTSAPEAFRRSAFAMGGIRAMAGFMTALVVFGFRTQGAPVMWYALVAVGGVAGSLSGAALAPAARSHVRSNRRLVALACLGVGSAAALATQSPDDRHRLGALGLAVVAGLAGSVAKTAFDATVQRQVPEAARARTFARLEATFQTGWVLAALVPTVLATSLPVGFTLIATTMIILGLTLVLPAFTHPS